MCGYEKKRSEFEKIKGIFLDISPICKICDNKVYGTGNIQFHFRVTNEEYKLTYELLTDIGYDVKGDIHRQFCDKYNLEYSERQPDFYENNTKPGLDNRKRK